MKRHMQGISKVKIVALSFIIKIPIGSTDATKKAQLENNLLR